MPSTNLTIDRNETTLKVVKPKAVLTVSDDKATLNINREDVTLKVNSNEVKLLSKGFQGPLGQDGDPGPQGIQGIQGPQGDPGVDGDKTYIHVQSAALTTWTINHDLNKYPAVVIVDSGNNVVIGDVTYIDTNNLIVEFSTHFGGTAYLN